MKARGVGDAASHSYVGKTRGGGDESRKGFGFLRPGDPEYEKGCLQIDTETCVKTNRRNDGPAITRACLLIRSMGKVAGCSLKTQGCALILFHRFCSVQVVEKFPAAYIATACLELSSKNDEDIKKNFRVFLNALRVEAMNKKALQNDDKNPLENDEFDRQRELLIKSERLVLTTLRFDLDVVNPFQNLFEVMQAHGLHQGRREELLPIDQCATNVLHDFLCSSKCVHYTPQMLACATIFYSFSLLEAYEKKGKLLGAAKPMAYRVWKTAKEGPKFCGFLIDDVRSAAALLAESVYTEKILI